MQRKLSILVLLPLIPFPPEAGGNICSYIFIEHLRKLHDFTVIIPNYSKEEKVQFDELSKKWPDVSIIPVKSYNKSLAGRIKNALRFKHKGATSMFDSQRYINPLSSISPQFINALYEQLSTVKFDIVQIESARYLPIVNILPGTVKKLYCEIESRYLILEDYKKVDSKYSNEYKQLMIEQIKLSDTANMSKFDSIMTLSHNDEKRVKNLLPGKPIYYSPYGLLEEKNVVLDSNRFKIEKLIFIGPEHHHPNRDAMEWFIEEIFSKLMGSDIELHVIGYWSDTFKQKYKQNKRVIFPGFVKDLSSYISNSIHVVPIRIGGGGLRAKNLVCLSEGVPMISTRLGCDGVSLTHGENVMFAENPAEFIQQIKHLLGNKDEAFRIADNGIKFYKQNYTNEIVVNLRNNIYNKIFSS